MSDGAEPAGIPRRWDPRSRPGLSRGSRRRSERFAIRRPSAARGRPHRPGENAAEIQAIETRLACNCGCTLDVFTCRTTDFSCTYSPKLHREVLALKAKGLTAQQVLDAFVAKYGEKALMAPKPKGFITSPATCSPAPSSWRREPDSWHSSRAERPRWPHGRGYVGGQGGVAGGGSRARRRWKG